MKTTVRVNVIIPDCYASIQRLYDDGKFFRLERETKTGGDAAYFIAELIKQGGRSLDAHEFVDDDDFKTKLSVTYEYISE